MVLQGVIHNRKILTVCAVLCCAELRRKDTTAGECLRIQPVTIGRGRTSSRQQRELWVLEISPFGNGLSVRQAEHGYVFRKLEAGSLLSCQDVS